MPRLQGVPPPCSLLPVGQRPVSLWLPSKAIASVSRSLPICPARVLAWVCNTAWLWASCSLSYQIFVSSGHIDESNGTRTVNCLSTHRCFRTSYCPFFPLLIIRLSKGIIRQLISVFTMQVWGSGFHHVVPWNLCYVMISICDSNGQFFLLPMLPTFLFLEVLRCFSTLCSYSLRVIR